MTEDQDVFRPAEYGWGSEPGPGAQRTSVPAASALGASVPGASVPGASVPASGDAAASAPVTARRPAAHAMPGPISRRCTRWSPGAATSATASSPTRSPTTC